MQGTCDKEVKVFKLIIFSCFISDTSVLICSFRLIKNRSSFNRNNIYELIIFIESVESAIKCLPGITDIIGAVTRDRLTASGKSPFYHGIWCSAYDRTFLRYIYHGIISNDMSKRTKKLRTCNPSKFNFILQTVFYSVSGRASTYRECLH